MARTLFDEDKLFAEARAATGLDDFGPEYFRVGLKVLNTALAEEAQLSPAAVGKAHYQIMEQLTKRLRMQDWFRRHPEIEREKIEAPIFILGSPRSGSSIMHELLSLDPANRAPAAWEVWNPTPPPEAATYHTDPRIAERQAFFDAIYAAVPELRSMHRMGATLPSECVEMTSMEFASVVFFVDFYIPSYSRWLYDEADFAQVFASHKRFLQLLQWRAPGAPWVLKSLYNMHYMDAFVAAYPDARVIWLHRDPLKALASGAHLASVMTRGSSATVDPLASARDAAHWSVVQHGRMVDVQERRLIPPERLINVQFGDFVRDHAGTVRRIYAHFGRELSAAAEQAMRRYLQEHTADQHGRHRYSMADMGLDEVEYRQKLARYQQYFDVPNEGEARLAAREVE